jgi:hypothetical protein
VGKPKAPEAPDYAGAAREQGTANLNSAIATNTLGRINQITPQGTISYEDTGSYTLPDGTVIPRQTATTTLSPDQQKLYDQNNQIASALNDVAIGGIDYVGNTANKPFDTSSLAGRVNTVAGAQGPAPEFQQTITGADDYSADRDRVTQALLERMRPEMERRENSLRNTLANQGLRAGGEAFNNEYQQFNQGRNDAEIGAFLAGGQEQSRLQGMDLNAGNFKNDAIVKAIMAAQARQGMDINAGSFANTSRQQGIQEQSFFRDQPLNTLNALRTGNQTQMPNFQGSSTAAVAAAPVYSATNDQYNAQLKQFEAQMGPWNALMGGLGSVGAAFAGK